MEARSADLSGAEANGPSIRVLQILCDPDERLLVRKALEGGEFGGVSLDECDGLSSGLARLREGAFDAVVLDLALAERDALSEWEVIRRASPGLAVVELASRNGANAQVVSSGDAAAKHGIDGPLLGATLRHVIERAHRKRDIELQAEACAGAKAELQELAYVVSHDLREPLRMVGSYVELLARHCEGKLDEEADRFIHYASDGAARLKSMIDDLLRYSRVGRGEPVREPIALAEVAQEAVASLGSRIREEAARVVVGELPTVLGDRPQLYDLLRQLIENAIRYRGEAAPSIEVRAVCEGAHCTVSVSDNGIGFEPDQAERIFRPFQRLHGRDDYPGNGIGLALVRRIVERHGGRVWAESEPGTGSVFRFRLRLAAGEGGGA